MLYRILTVLILFYGLLLAQRGQQEFPWEKNGQQQDVIRIPTQYNFSINQRPPINFNIFVDFTENDLIPQFRIGTAILYDLLQFKKNDKIYAARYQIGLVIRDDERTIVNNTWNEEVVLESFEETNAKDKYDLRTYTVSANGSAPAGQYEGWLEIHDLTSRQTFRSKRPVKVPGPGQKGLKQLIYTDLTFVIESDSISESLHISPALSTLEFNKPYKGLLRIANITESMDINIRLYYQKEDVESLYQQDFLKLVPENGIASFYYTLPMDSMPEGDYKIRIRSENPELEVEKHFSVIWFDKPVYLYKSDLALQPMRYILSEEEFDRAESLNRKKLSKWIHQFWKAKDPTPETDYNEISDEFYSRVHDANQRFSHKYKKGWQTDRGRILILYGEPKEIENNRYSTELLPHIIWKYQDGQEFVFVDKDNDEDFTLLEE